MVDLMIVMGGGDVGTVSIGRRCMGGRRPRRGRTHRRRRIVPGHFTGVVDHLVDRGQVRGIVLVGRGRVKRHGISRHSGRCFGRHCRIPTLATMPTIVLTRHGLTPRSRPEQHLGQQIDIGLSEEGRAQARGLAERVAHVGFGRVISSPLRRAVETADLISDRPVEVDARMLEMDYGAWEGLTYEQIDEQFAAERARWLQDPAAMPCPGGESGNDVAARVRSLLDDVLDGFGQDGPILLVGHSTTNRILICVALAIPIREYRLRVIQSQVNLTALEWRPGAPIDGATALLLNDVAHVRRPPQTPWD